MPSDASPKSPTSPDSERRRLLLGGASLLALGLVLQVGRLWPAPEATHEAEVAPPDDVEVDDAPRHAAAGQRHRGEEGRMGRPTTKSGLYAMKGPEAVSSPSDVWGGLQGTEVGESFGVGGLGLQGTGRGGGGTGEGTIGLGTTGLIGKGGGGRGSGFGSGRRHAPDGPSGGTLALPREPLSDGGFVAVADDRLSTFSIDVDTASYSTTRRSLEAGRLPEPDAVRIEELVNYFDYDYAAPTGDVPFSVTAEVGECPWDPEHELVHLGLQGKVVATSDLPPRNLVFLVDVSGSMHGPDKLPLVKHSLRLLVEQLRAEDTISMVVYAGAAGVVLSPTSGAAKGPILEAIDALEAGGSTNGSGGIALAYAQAREALAKDGVNRVILATDGDFNVGVSSHDELVAMIAEQRKTGIELSVLGYGMGSRDHTMEQLADAGNGNYAYVDGPEEAHKVLVKEVGGTLVTIAKDVKIQVELDPARVLSYRLVGYENRRLAHRDFADDTKDAGEIGAGHSVTALYEVVPRPDADPAAPWMTVSVRHKPPKGSKSARLSLPVVAQALPLADTSDDFRFSAAVASLGMLLRAHGERTGAVVDAEARGRAPTPTLGFAGTQALARAALGDDPSCLRRRFVALVGTAGALAGDPEVSTDPAACGAPPAVELPPVAPPPRPLLVQPPPSDLTRDPAEPAPAAAPSSVGPWVLEVLRLLPPLLALPLFVMALRRPRRRR